LPQKTEPKFIRISGAIKRYSLSRSTFYRAIDKGEIHPIKKGGCVLFSIDALDKWILSETSSTT